VPPASGNPAAGFATGILTKYTFPANYWGDRPKKQQNGFEPNIFRIALQNPSPWGSALAAKKKNRRPNSADIGVGESLRVHRQLAGMSQSELAGKLGVSFQQIQKYEKGANRIGAGRLSQIAEIFDVPIAALFDVNATTSSGESVPIKLIPDRGTLKLLTGFGSIPHREVRHSLIGLVDAIARIKPKARR
jgi:transcriptional regulator with XRE-family HTH domain